MPAKPQPFSLVNQTYETRDGLWSKSRTINFYPCIDTSGTAQSKVELAPCPGIAAFSSVANPLRGLWVGDNRLFAVGAGTVYEISSSGAATAVGDPILNAQTPVQFASDGNALAVASGNEIWVLATPDGGGPIGSTMVHAGISIVYLDSYWIILLPDSNVFIYSLDMENWAEAEGDAVLRSGGIDRAVSLQVHEGHLWIFGRRTITPYYNSGDAFNPWQPIPGAAIDTGTLFPWSITKIDQRLYWLGNDDQGDGRVFRTQGYTPVRISTQSIEYLIRQCILAGTADEHITGCGYEENGHTFYVLTFPGAGKSFVYDLSTEMWHERNSWDRSQFQLWKGAGFHGYVCGKHLVGSMGSGTIYEQSTQLYTEAGAPIRRYRACPYVQADQQWLFHHYLRLLTGGDTAVNMRYQSDDQSTWSTTRTVTPFKNEVEYRRLGRARDRLYEVWVMDSSSKPTSILEAWLHAGPGTQR